LSGLASRNPGDFRLAGGLCAASPWSTWASVAESGDLTDLEREVVRIFCELKKQFGISRRLLREMGNRAGVEIEPAQQTALCDASEALPGVLCAGVPGAGGVDAIFAITLSNASRSNVETMWSEWGLRAGAACKVCPLVLSADKSPVCGVRIEV
jgi:phosphomevalonate kinase